MRKQFLIIFGLLTLFFCLETKPVLAQKAYNPLVRTWLNEINQKTRQYAEQNLQQSITESLEKECDSRDWSGFQRSFLSYDNFIGNWSDVKRNDCLREDVWLLEDKLSQLNKLGIQQALQCSSQLDNLKNIYTDLQYHLQGLRTYGEKPLVEQGDSQNCPNCRKAEIVGNKNLQYQYSSNFYTDAGCQLTKNKSKAWKEEWQKLQKSMNLFKNIRNIWSQGFSQHSWSFTAEDYSKAQNKSTSWWNKTWKKLYNYNGRQLYFQHLKDEEDTFINSDRILAEYNYFQNELSKLKEVATIEELVAENKLQQDVYNEMLLAEEIQTEQTDLVEFKTKLGHKYKIQSTISSDLENYLIDVDNSIKSSIPILKNYAKKLRQVASKHCVNLYGACK